MKLKLGVGLARAIGIVVVGLLGLGARSPSPEVSNVENGAARFAFSSTTVDHQFGGPLEKAREVHKELHHIRPWMSSLGGAAALGDIDGNLKPDDLCYVDTRQNEAIVAPAMGDKYAPFRLIAPRIDATMAPQGCLIGDLNEDGLPDMVVYYWGRTPVAFLRIDNGPATLDTPPGASQYRAVELVAGNQRWFTSAATLSDLDGDGHLDIVVGNYICDGARPLDSKTTEILCPTSPGIQDSFSRAFNGGTDRILRWKSATGGTQPAVEFEDLSSVFPKQVADGWTLAIGAQDLNGDTLPDLYVANDFGPDRMMMNCSRETREARKELGCYPLEGPISFRLMHGEWSFFKPGSKTIGNDSFKGMGVDFTDLNGDGIPDIYVSNLTDTWAFFESHFVFLSDGRALDRNMVKKGVAPYSDASEQIGVSRTGWAWDAKFVDFDNDGVMELLQATGFMRGRQAGSGFSLQKSCWVFIQELATGNDELVKYPRSWFSMSADESGVGCDISGSNRNPFFVRTASGRYADLSPQLPHISRSPAPTRGLAIGDVDQDGRTDYVEAKMYAPAEFHRNVSESAKKNAFIGISPRFLVAGDGKPGVASIEAASARTIRSRPAIGAQLRIKLPDGRVVLREVDGGNGHSGKRSPDIHVGLGPDVPANSTAEVQITWPSGGASRTYTVKVNQYQALLLQP